MRRLEEAVYRVLLLAFPSKFRRHHAPGMLEQFRAQRHAASGLIAIVGFWLRVIGDALRHGLGQRVDGRRSRLRSTGSVQRSFLNGGLDPWRDGFDDTRKVLRGLRRQPGFTVTAVATLALGIGANAAIFALAWHTTFRPLPYPHPEQLIRIFESNPTGGQPITDVSPASLKAWAERATTIESVGTWGRSRAVFAVDDDRATIRYQVLSPAVLSALQIRPLLGRAPLTDAERQPDEVLLSYEYWQRRFGGDSAVIDRVHHFEHEDEPERIIGVMPPGFQFGQDKADVWAVNPSYAHGTIGARYRSVRQDSVLARIRRGHTLAEATAEVERISAELATEFPDTHAGWRPIVRTLHETEFGRFSALALLLVSAACAVFLVSCTNIAGLLIMQASKRSQEVRLRVALGASRWRIVRLWMIEGAVVASLSLAAGLTVAGWIIVGLKSLAPTTLPRLDDVSLSWPIVAVAAAGAVVFVLISALVPLLTGVLASRSQRLDANAGLQRVTSGSRGRGLLLASQAGFATVLLTGALLFGTSLQHLHSEPLGFEPSGVLSMKVSLDTGSNRRPWAISADFAKALEEQLTARPDIDSAAVSNIVPLDGGGGDSFFQVDDDPTEQRWGAVLHQATPGYLETVGLTLTSGRWFTDQDRFTSEQLIRGDDEPIEAAVVTQSMANTLWPGQSALGKRLLSVIGDNPKVVVGVVDDLKFQRPDLPPTFRVFVSWYQSPGAGSFGLFVRAKSSPLSLVDDVSALVRTLRPTSRVRDVRTLDDLVQASSADTSFATGLVGGFSVLALVLTGIGVFGVVGYSIATRRRELAVRMALGAGRRDVSVTATKSAMGPIVLGTGLGLAAALGSVRFVRGLLFEVNPLSPTHYLVAGGVLLAVAAMAAALPLRRVTAIDPAESLRAE